MNLKKKSLQIAQFSWQFKEAKTEKKSWLFGTYLCTCLSTARTTWNVARDVSGRIALS
jgi:hypothetical protein